MGNTPKPLASLATDNVATDKVAQKLYPLEPLFGRILSPFEDFLQRTSSGGILLILTTIGTLALAYFIGEASLHHFWQTPLTISLGGQGSVGLSLHHWVNDGLMALFFLIVGLELKREILVGELASLRDAALPVIAALGGMLVPAGLFALLNRGVPTLSGWGIPMATDIAFAIGILVLLGWRIPKNLVIFLTALAIADDLGAVLVIAIFYTETIHLAALLAAAVISLLLMVLNRGGVRHPLPYWLLGIALWCAMFLSGIHATIAGIILAFTIPSRPSYLPLQFDRRMVELRDAFRSAAETETRRDTFSNQTLAAIAESIENAASTVQSPLQRIEHALNPWVTFLILPLFALSNTGIDLSQLDIVAAVKQPLTQGIIIGLVFGKFVGIALFSYLAVALKIGRLPQGVEWKHLLGAAWLGGIGFTMSLFVGQLAFTADAVLTQVKLGVLMASSLAASIGIIWLIVAADKIKPPRPPTEEGEHTQSFK